MMDETLSNIEVNISQKYDISTIMESPSPRKSLPKMTSIHVKPELVNLHILVSV